MPDEPQRTEDAMIDIETSELTDWMPGTLEPVHEGVYQRRMSDGSFSCWTGRVWNRDAATPDEAAGSTSPSRDQRASWRGLATPSALPCATCGGHTIVDRGYDAETDRDLLEECPDC